MLGLAALRRFLITLFVIVMMAEVFLRWAIGLGDPPLAVLDEAVEYRLLPSATYSRFGNLIEINRYGMRGSDHPEELRPDERRVLLIGDSVVYGNHFLDQAEIISVQMGHYLAASPRLSNCAPRTMALAASSWGPVNQMAALEQVGTLNADVAVLVVSAHDLYDVPGRSNSVLPYRLEPSLTALGDVIKEVRERWRLANEEVGSLSADEAMRSTLQALDSMAGHLERAGIPLLIGYHSSRNELAGADRPEQAVFEEWAVQWQVPYFDLREAISPEGFRDDIHPNALGASQIGASLAEQVAEYLPECVIDKT